MIRAPLLFLSLCCILQVAMPNENCTSVWEPWTEWSLCSDQNTVSIRQRNCTTTASDCIALCHGKETEEERKDCESSQVRNITSTATSRGTTSPPICHTVGEWTQWTGWTECDGKGVQNRSRYCDTVPPGCKMGQGFMCDNSTQSYNDSRPCGDTEQTSLPSTGFVTITTAVNPSTVTSLLIGTSMVTDGSPIFESSSTVLPSTESLGLTEIITTMTSLVSPHLPPTTTTIPPTTTTPLVVTTTITPSPCQGIIQWTQWTAWQPCSATCGNCGQTVRFRSCEELSAPTDDCKCPSKKLESELKHCESRTCPGVRPCCDGHLAGEFNEKGEPLCVPGVIPKFAET
ncbi:hypothetical protein QR680_004691 [Steinernema hermaphroditum]|uniref:Uncharacterized protein n=1 Tax=Steinernema hermaphroditum TaxID=289476 RepID=A0AA39LUE3_9BILA|nr:hypothetical protein QR680_004691 [Steinernema hermaphroditum]